MKTVTDYQILCAQSPSDLSQKVKIGIEAGWQPHGVMNVNGFFSQPMVKYLEDSAEYKYQQAKHRGPTGKHLS